jgi:ribosomal protein L35
LGLDPASVARYYRNPYAEIGSSQKTKKAVAKRFKVTGTGKVLRSHASRRHLMSSKSAKRKRHLAKSALVDASDVARIKENLPFG